jgi:hypothetical protein
MSFNTINRCANDTALIARITACVAQEQQARGEPPSPNALQETMRWAVATAADVEAAYASALAANNPDPGGDEAVITDGMILANVQADWPAAPPP